MLELGVAIIYDRGGRTTDALAIFAAVVPGFERDGLQTVNLPVFYVLWADLERRADRCDDAIPHYRKSAELGRAFGPDNLEVGTALRGEAECLYRAGRHADAIDRLEAAAVLPVAAYNGEDAGFGKALLGMLYAETGRDRARGLALVREAVAEIAASDPDLADPRHARITAWLATHAP
jgi:tetratricopeptide (TPR) repeat protein